MISSNLHPSKDIQSKLGNSLDNRKIVVCVTASVSCYKSIDLIRMLMRYGADVYVVISKTVEKFISSEYFLWASGNNVVSRLSGNLEHVYLADYGKSDLIVVYPATANTIGKFSNGIDDTPVTSILSIALGANIPIIIAPAMHESMYNNNIIKKNIEKLVKNNVRFINPNIIEGKAKVADVELVVNYIISLLTQKNTTTVVPVVESKKSKDCLSFLSKSIKQLSFIEDSILYDFFKNKDILISVGSTIEYIDPIRIISNTSSGKMGFSLVRIAKSFKSNVTVIKGFTSTNNNEVNTFKNDNNFKLIEVKTSDQMYDAIVKELHSKTYDIVILAAAVSDFKPALFSENKISSSNNELSITLIPTIKIINQIKIVDNNVFLVGFKADHCVENNYLLEKSFAKLQESNANLIVANDVGNPNTTVGSDYNKVLILDRSKSYYESPLKSKDEIAKDIFRVIFDNMKIIKT